MSKRNKRKNKKKIKNNVIPFMKYLAAQGKTYKPPPDDAAIEFNWEPEDSDYDWRVYKPSEEYGKEKVYVGKFDYDSDFVEVFLYPESEKVIFRFSDEHTNTVYYEEEFDSYLLHVMIVCLQILSTKIAEDEGF